jgi:hypothetical protein
MRKTPTLYLALIGLLTLSMASVAYAHWQKIITVDGVVHSGTVDWEWSNIDTIDPGVTKDWHIQQGFIGDKYHGDKHVGTTEVFYDVDTRKIVHVVLTNVYPCYFTEVTLYPKNTGTIPIKIDELVVYDGDGNEIFRTRSTDNYYFALYNEAGECEVEFKWGDNFGGQLRPGENQLEVSFWIHICEAAIQDPDDTPEPEYTFTMELSCINWNEYVSPSGP